MVVVGDKVRFDPFEETSGFSSELNKREYITGDVVLVNYGHRWFSVEYGNPAMRISFKFCDIGKTVTVCG